MRMVRFRRQKRWLKELAESTTTERILLILPFFILSLDLYLLLHALSLGDMYIIVPVLILFAFSVVEIVVTLDEIHERAVELLRYKKLETKVRKAMEKKSSRVTVRSLLNDILEEHPELRDHEKSLYHVICQILAGEENRNP